MIPREIFFEDCPTSIHLLSDKVRELEGEEIRDSSVVASGNQSGQCLDPLVMTLAKQLRQPSPYDDAIKQ